MKLEGIRVLDLSRFLPGPHLAMMMADHGADVIKIEGPRSGDPARVIGPAEGGHTVYFRNANRGKRSLAVDLKSEAGREAFMRLAETADVILETFRPGVVDRLGIGYEAVRGRAPQVVYASISAFGQSGPYRRPASPRPQRQRARRHRQPQRRRRRQARHGLPAALRPGGLADGARRHPHGPAAPPDHRARGLRGPRHVRRGGFVDGPCRRSRVRR